MRKIPSLLSVLALAAVSLVGCSTGGASACDRTSGDPDSVTDLVSVSGEFGSAPDVSIPTPFKLDAPAYADLETGRGNDVRTAEQLLVLDLTLVDGTSGDVILQTEYADVPTRVLKAQQWIDPLPGIEDALMCATEGSRVVVALPPGGILPEAAVQIGATEDDSVVAVLDLRKVYLSAAEGTLQFNQGTGLPSVVRAPDGRPGIIVPDGAPPADLRIETLIKGAGDVVTADAPVRVHYTGVVWDTKEVFDSSWESGTPASFTLDGVVPGFAAALEGQTVGSQVLAVVPPDQGYGDQEQGRIPAGSTLVFVVDILGIDPATSQ